MTIVLTKGEDLADCDVSCENEYYIFINPQDPKLSLPENFPPFHLTIIPILGSYSEDNIATFMAYYLGKIDQEMPKEKRIYIHKGHKNLKDLVKFINQTRLCELNCSTVELLPPPSASLGEITTNLHSIPADINISPLPSITSYITTDTQEKVLENFRMMQSKHRPSSIKALKNWLSNRLSNDNEINNTITYLLRKKYITEIDNKLHYSDNFYIFNAIYKAKPSTIKSLLNILGKNCHLFSDPETFIKEKLLGKMINIDNKNNIISWHKIEE